MSAGVLALLAIVPGLPTMPFLLVSGLLGFAAYAHTTEAPPEEPVVAPPPAQDPLESAITVDALSVEVGYALISLVDERQGGTLLTRVRSIRKQIAADTGIVVPAVHIADNLQLGPRAYAILVKGVEVARGELYPDRLLAINPGTAGVSIEGIATREPAFGLPAWWIPVDARDRTSSAGYTVVDPTTALSTHLSETIRTFLPDLLGRQQTKDMVDRVAQTAPKLVEELVPKLVAIGDIQRVLRQLLRERVPVRDLTTILEAVADAASVTKDPDQITETVRVSLGRAICRQFQNDQGELPAIGLAPALEQRLIGAIVRTEHGSVLALDPADAQNIAARIARALESAVAQPVLLCSPVLRPHLWRMFTRVLPHLGVLSHGEVPPHVRLAPVAVID
jgi:flagellar biosynthesis protein FlhA